MCQIREADAGSRRRFIILLDDINTRMVPRKKSKPGKVGSRGRCVIMAAPLLYPSLADGMRHHTAGQNYSLVETTGANKHSLSTKGRQRESKYIPVKKSLNILAPACRQEAGVYIQRKLHCRRQSSRAYRRPASTRNTMPTHPQKAAHPTCGATGDVTVLRLTRPVV
jgi:hypothetical protein